MSINKGLFSSQTDEWATPQDVFDKLNDEFHFTLDPCANQQNAKCEKYYTKNENGLVQDWGGIMFFAIHLMGKKYQNGLRNAQMKAQNAASL